MFSIDRAAFDENSAFRKRILDYGSLFDKLHVVIYTKPGFIEIDLGARVHIVPTNSSIKFLALRDMYRVGAHILKADTADWVITSQEEFTGAVCAFLKWRYGVPWQAQIHSDVFSSYFRKFSAKNALRVFIALRLVRYATRIRVVGERMRIAIERIGVRTPVDVLPIFVYTARFREIAEMRAQCSSGSFDFIFLMVSRLAPEKNIPMAIRAFAEIVKQFPKTTLRIVGDGPLRGELEKLSVSLNLGSRIQFEGWQKVIDGYLKAADCFLSTSWYEGYGMNVVEAMAAGLPVITTDVGVTGDLIENGKTGLVVAPGDENAFRTALIEIMSQEQLRAALGTAASLRVNNLPSYQEYLKLFHTGLALCLQNKN
jgi:glycosyltransferase involved in cell wall biosynthesis